MVRATALNATQPNTPPSKGPSPMAITNDNLRSYSFLKEMYEDDYFPTFLVDKCRNILVGLCEEIERVNPATDSDVLELTHAATEEINDLASEFEDNDSELETNAREILAADFDFIVKAYGFDLDVEEIIAPREW